MTDKRASYRPYSSTGTHLLMNHDPLKDDLFGHNSPCFSKYVIGGSIETALDVDKARLSKMDTEISFF